eukprot:gnl/TRDRNA2_/TRDRNA2_143056_c0_seq1.p1 gnl/TRDRNA2_/TRDRNA2_143056_c0~~gnl/TRDRNA2_/TRDRNA2_143056_c0_seq1.p1  ORF type:complete len:133 (-),score=25.40 gnl/TRDRNA2_/TRDRNA2_143056_c0_seq1:6-404(-)
MEWKNLDGKAKKEHPHFQAKTSSSLSQQDSRMNNGGSGSDGAHGQMDKSVRAAASSASVDETPNQCLVELPVAASDSRMNNGGSGSDGAHGQMDKSVRAAASSASVDETPNQCLVELPVAASESPPTVYSAI